MFHNLCSRDSPICRHMNLQCVSAKKQYGAEGEKNSNYNFTTLRGRGKDSPHTVYHKIRKEKRTRGSSEKSKKKISEKAWQMFTQITNLNLPLRFFPLCCVYLNGYRIGK